MEETMVARTLPVVLVVIAWLGLSGSSARAQVGAAELARALKECQEDLHRSAELIDSLRGALMATEQLWEARKAATDSLVANLEKQLKTQAEITSRFRANADTLELMVQDYAQKLDEVNRLYVQELQRRARPWFLSSKGLTGFAYGLFIGGALGVTYVAVLK